jgi:hypothetical protein
MDCVNHSGVTAAAWCQNCGKPLCSGCVRSAAGGQILCQPCSAAWQSYQQPFAVPPSGPSPSAAAVLGLIPGVGAMYNGQFFKGLIHVVIFAVLVSITSSVRGNLDTFFGLLIPAWILYQSFEAFHTAKALRDGQPPPDPLGLNEVGNWLNLGTRHRYPGQPDAQPSPAQPNPNPYPPGPAAQGSATYGSGQAPFTPPGPSVPPGSAPGASAPGAVGPGFYPGGQPGTQSSRPGDPGFTPDPSAYWHPFFCRRREPVGAVILIALGLLFLLGQLDIFNGLLFKFTWPLALIALGVWLIIRRLGDFQGGPK